MARRKIIRSRSPAFDYSGSTDLLYIAIVVTAFSVGLYLPRLEGVRDFFTSQSHTLTLAQWQDR